MERVTERSVNGTPICFYRGEITEKEYRDKCKEVLRKCCEYEDTGLEPEEIEAMKNNGAWIPVSERLPSKSKYLKNDGRFIITDGNRVCQGIFDIYTDGLNKPYWPFETCRPIAWYPLPEPYRPQED